MFTFLRKIKLHDIKSQKISIIIVKKGYPGVSYGLAVVFVVVGGNIGGGVPNPLKQSLLGKNSIISRNITT